MECVLGLSRPKLILRASFLCQVFAPDHYGDSMGVGASTNENDRNASRPLRWSAERFRTAAALSLSHPSTNYHLPCLAPPMLQCPTRFCKYPRVFQAETGKHAKDCKCGTVKEPGCLAPPFMARRNVTMPPPAVKTLGGKKAVAFFPKYNKATAALHLSSFPLRLQTQSTSILSTTNTLHSSNQPKSLRNTQRN